MSAPCRRLRLTLEPRAARDLSWLLQQGAEEFCSTDQGDRVVLEVRYDAERPDYLEDRLESWLHHVDPHRTCRLETARDELAWEPGWRGVFGGGPVGTRFHVHPPWGQPDPDRLDLEVDPAGGFGSGFHPTTRATLCAMEAALPEGSGASLLDVGCGTGILSLAAARLGLRPTALDVSEPAREATRRTARANDVQVTVLETGLEPVKESFPFVVANLFEQALTELAASLSRAVEPGGLLILGGLHPDALERVLPLYPLTPSRRVQRDSLDGTEWVTVVLGS